MPGADEQKIDQIIGTGLDAAGTITPSFAEHLTSGLRKREEDHFRP